jgi:PKD repeat protein
MAVAALALPGAVSAADPPTVGAAASVARGAVPLAVTFTATGDASSYTWDFGDGTSSAGPAASHVYATPGAYRATVTGTAPTGETSTAAVSVLAARVTLQSPAQVNYGRRIRFSGRIEPALARVPVVLRRGETVVARARTTRSGAFTIRRRGSLPGAFTADVAGIRSQARPLVVRPRLRIFLPPSIPLGARVALDARVTPRNAGRLQMRLMRGTRVLRQLEGKGTVWSRIPARRRAVLRAEIWLAPRPGFLPVRTTRRTAVRLPELAVGSQGEAVLALERRLRALHFALPTVDRLYGWETAQAVLAFRKANGLPWLSTMDARAWRALDEAHTPWPRHGYGDHVEVSKTRQLLMLVRGGKVQLVTHVSTGATGNTPVGVWHVYRKVVGWDWVLWYPSYFLRGFAIHGYPDVPAYPASHGCVRVPMWLAPRLYEALPYGATVWVDP